MLLNYVENKDPEKKYIDEGIVLEVVEYYYRLFGHFDSIFSILRTKKIHTTIGLEDRLAQHLTHALALIRFLHISITPKIYLLEDHVLHFFNIAKVLVI